MQNDPYPLKQKARAIEKKVATTGGLYQAKKDYDWVTALLGGCFTAPAIISLIQHGLQIELNWGFWHFVNFYRSFVTPIVDFIQFPLRQILAWWHIAWPIPQWLKDLHALSFVGVAVWIRAMSTVRIPGRQPSNPIADWLFGLFLGYIGVGLLQYLRFLPSRRDANKPPAGSLEASISHLDRSVRRIFAILFFAVIAFYVGNAVLPQVGPQNPG
jgi:hypothetical protein